MNDQKLLVRSKYEMLLSRPHVEGTNKQSKAISPFPTVFSTPLENFLPFSSNSELLSANSFSLEETRIYKGKG